MVPNPFPIPSSGVYLLIPIYKGHVVVLVDDTAVEVLALTADSQGK